MKTIRMVLISLAVAGLAAQAEEKPGKKPGAAQKPGIKKPGDNNAKTEFNGILNRCDADKNGRVTLDEFKSHQPAGKDPASVKKWFNEHDRNNDGEHTDADFVPPVSKK